MAAYQNTTPVKNISIYIPRMAENSHEDSDFNNLTDFIADRFQNLEIGIVEDIKYKKGFVNKEGRVYYKTIITFDLWYDNGTTRTLQDRILNPQDYNNKYARLVYDDPHYWILLEHKVEINTKLHTLELVSKLEQQLAQVSHLAEMFKLAQLNKESYEMVQPGSKRPRVANYAY